MNARIAATPAGALDGADFARLHPADALARFIPNVPGRMQAIGAGDARLPVLVCEPGADAAWTCSPTTAWARCGREEAARTLPGWLGAPVGGLLRGVEAWLARAGVDRVVVLDHWLLSTDLHAPVAGVDLPRAMDEARDRWPGHALWMRSLNAIDNADWLQALERAGSTLVASRQVYLYRDVPALVARHRDMKRDFALLAKTALHRAHDDGIGERDYARIAQLYAQLYLDKYSRFNPMYTEAFLRAWHRAGLLEFHGFRNDAGDLACIVGLFRRAGTVSAPIVGYDTQQPQSLGLYRLLTALAFERVAQTGERLNFSAGAAGFKRSRGGIPAIEYGAFDVRHLPRRSRAAVALLSQATRRIGVPLLQHYRL
ncbi:hypothetical protein LYSHEL_01870 [Lysobacter helvus]|uniref:GNAT family N-acetyltransferase n=2 Tax=Lysobacteraceae TaxID=32033 RepID=A0ABN6FNN0_9GAMM|nr:MULTISPECIES: hypothetical protein [Lysobacter]BCT91163.1 hypothetical protein LYSCAS_01870 [Lysobacter caseinilyticus]BCT94316.1 hypothetical protein LYSHEL_01870 [Lysobacter helvus]